MKPQLRKRLLFGGGALILLIIGGVLLNRTPSDVSEGPMETIPTVKPIEEVASEKSPLPPSEPPSKPALSENAKPVQEELKPFANNKELAEYKILARKIFLTEDEKTQRKNFLQDRSLLESLRELFKFPAPIQDLENQQNVAVDLLLDAIKSGGDAETARAVFKDLIADATIEDNQLSAEQRQNLAGVKAEVLYQWSALEPDRTREIKRYLPGPVSKKIWQNVEDQQELNAAESATTK